MDVGSRGISWHHGKVDDTLPESPYEVLEKLPSPSPHLHRFRARVRETGKEVELRASRSPERQDWLGVFGKELKDLTLLDHPVFLPVLERGVQGDRNHYAVPLRLDPHLGQVVTREELGMEARIGILTFLLGGVVHAHEKGIAASILDPVLVALSRCQGLPYLIHHRVPADALPGGPPDRLPEDCKPGSVFGPRADLFLWGRLAWWFLTAGEHAYPRQPGPVRRSSLRSRVERIPVGIAEVIDACLVWSPEGRPESAREVHEVIVAEAVSRPVSPAGLPEAEAQGELILDSTEFDLQKMRQKARAGPGAAPGKVDSKTLEVQAITGATPENPDPGGASRPPSGGSGLRWGMALGFLVAALALGLSVEPTAEVRPPSAPSPVIRRAEPTALAPRREIQEVAEVDRSRYLKDPRVRHFLGGSETTPERFRERWQDLIRLSLRRRVPGIEQELPRIEQLKDVFRKDPRAACEELDFYRRSLSNSLGLTSGGSEAPRPPPAPPR